MFPIKPVEKGSTSYEPTRIPKDKYEKIVEGRNRFFVVCVLALGGFMAASAVPQYLMNRSLRRMYERFCHGKVLDLSPKLYDERDVALYESSRAIRVQYLVEKKVVDDGRYKIDDSLSAVEQEERRRAMTLDFMTKNDHHWVGSTVSFDVVERSDTQLPDFVKYDCVVIRDELMNRGSEEARQLFDSAATYLRADGSLLVMDFGKSSYPMVHRFLRWFNATTNSSMCFTHDYHAWIKEDMLYELVEEHRTLFGLHYAMHLRPKKDLPIS